MPAKTEKQQRAMYAAAAGNSTIGIPQTVGKEFTAKDKKRIKGAGIMLTTPDNEVLFLLRSPTSNHPGEWDFPGGKAEEDETPEETAKRETQEEIGSRPYGELTKLADTESADDSGHNVDFITYRQLVRHKFKPKLDPGEHTGAVWRQLTNPPEPLHPGVREVVDIALGKHKQQAVDAMPKVLAFDRASVRVIDKDGRMMVELSHISKAMVCPYFGSEIPDYQKLGLDAEKTYMLFRDPEELKKSVPTWNGIQLLNTHIAVDVKDHKPENIIGSTGTDAAFNYPYLDNSLSIWTEGAIKGIESGEQQEISCGYYYDADMTPGNFEGQAFDGVMRNIIGNHVALVTQGRAGPDVMVGDSLNQNGAIIMTLSKRATKAKGALLAYLKPAKMATDSVLNLDAILDGVKRKNWHDKKPGIVQAIKPLLAKDADLKDIVALLDKLDGAPADNDNLGQDVDPKHGEILDKLRGKISDEDLQEIEAILKSPEAKPAANDEPAQTANAAESDPKAGANNELLPAANDDDDEDDMVSKTAMDAAIKKASKEAESKTIARMNSISEAREIVRPYVGELTAMDSGESVFKAALKALKVDISDVHPSAYRAVLQAQPKPGDGRQVHIAKDSSFSSSVIECFPDLNRKL